MRAVEAAAAKLAASTYAAMLFFSFISGLKRTCNVGCRRAN